MTDADHLIWSNYSLDYDDWKDDLEAEYTHFGSDDRALIPAFKMTIKEA